jgi:hypothetical protein
MDQFCQKIVDLLRDDLVGIYLHGSLAMGCFNPQHSDMDVLVVSQAAIPLPVKAELGRLLLRLSLLPSPIEIHFLNLAGLHPWRYPPPFDLHYSGPWRDRFERDLASGGWLPAALRPTIRTALDFYQHGQSSSEFSPAALAELLIYMREKIGFF